MTTLCGCKETTKLKVEADMGADPIWCAVCNYNLDLEEIELSAELAKDLFIWVNDYASWVDWETETLIEGQEAVEADHNQRGEELTKLAQQELNGQYEVEFKSSNLY